jgi:hypothetical protein
MYNCKKLKIIANRSILSYKTKTNMQYLVTYTENGIQKAFYTNWFDIENNFNSEVGMVVFDLSNHKYMVNSLGWTDIEEDHL